MQVVQGKKLTAMPASAFAELRDRASRVVVDVGTGDARSAYRLARAQPDWLVVGVDPAWRRMSATSVRGRRKAAKGGTPNLVLVNATIEAVPDGLAAVADEVLVQLPWGKLLRGLVRGDQDVCAGLRQVARPGASLEVTVATSIWRDPVPLEIRELPELTPAYVSDVLAGRLARYGWQVTAAELVSSAALETISSSWARRLGSSAGEAMAHLKAIAA